MLHDDKLLTEKIEIIKKELVESLNDNYSISIDHISEIGYDDEFIIKAFKYFKENQTKTIKLISILLDIRQKYSLGSIKIDKDFVKSSINDNYAFWFKKCKNNHPTLIIKVKNSEAGKQSINERISFGFYLFEYGLYLTKQHGVSKFSIIYDRSDFEQEKHFDERIPKILKRYYDKELSECLLEWIDHVYVLNIGFIYRSMFEIYKAFKQKKSLDKIKLIGDNKDLLKYYDSESLPEEYK